MADVFGTYSFLPSREERPWESFKGSHTWKGVCFFPLPNNTVILGGVLFPLSKFPAFLCAWWSWGRQLCFLAHLLSRKWGRWRRARGTVNLYKTHKRGSDLKGQQLGVEKETTETSSLKSKSIEMHKWRVSWEKFLFSSSCVSLLVKGTFLVPVFWLHSYVS